MMDMPRRLRQRPRFQGLPIPYTTFIGSDGQPDFKVIDMVAIQTCYKRRLCALCGQDLPERIVFIGGASSVEHCCFLDPAMHPDCALYAVGVCPYLANPSGDYSNAPLKHRADSDVVFINYNMPPGRPDKMAFYHCKGYDVIQGGKNVIMVKAWPATKIDWDIIPQRT
jgi:hypothetical protein